MRAIYALIIFLSMTFLIVGIARRFFSLPEDSYLTVFVAVMLSWLMYIAYVKSEYDG